MHRSHSLVHKSGVHIIIIAPYINFFSIKLVDQIQIIFKGENAILHIFIYLTKIHIILNYLLKKMNKII